MQTRLVKNVSGLYLHDISIQSSLYNVSLLSYYYAYNSILSRGAKTVKQLSFNILTVDV